MRAFKNRTTKATSLLFLLILFFTNYGFAQWDTIYNHAAAPFALSEAQSRLQLFGPDTAYAMFYDMRVVKTIDAGATWTTINLSTAAEPYPAPDMYFYDRNNGFLIYRDSTNSTLIRKTADAGQSWSTITLPALPAILSDFHVFFSSTTTGFVFDQTYLLRTTDGGTTWNVIPSFNVRVKAMYFTSASVGYAAGYNPFTAHDIVLKTTDSGATWTPTVLPDFTILQSITFVSATTGFAGGYNTIYKTTDAGATWSITYTYSSPLSLSGTLALADIEFPAVDTGYALGVETLDHTKANILRTTDGGTTWNAYSACNRYAGRIAFQNTQTGYLVSDFTIEKTLNGAPSCPGVNIMAYSPGNMLHANDSTSLLADPTLNNNYVYSWSPAANMDNSGMQATRFSTSVAGVLTPVYVTLTDTAFGCPPVTAEAFIYTFPAFTGTVNAGNDTTICGGPAPLLLTATTNWNDSVCTFTWMPGSLSGPTISVFEANNAQYVVTAHFPDASAATDTINVTMHYSFNDTVMHCTAPVTIGLPFSSDGSFLWDSGELTDTISVSAPGVHSCVATYTSPACVTNNTFTVIDSCNTISNVWPGDTNLDLIVSNEDVLNVGLAYNTTGPARPGNPWAWAAQPMIDWTQNFSAGLNYKHADCSGDGMVSSWDDDSVISYHYNYVHPPMLAQHATQSRSTADLYLVADHDSVGLTSTVVFSIMLGNSVPIDSIYGISYSLSYETDLLYQPVNLFYYTSWFGDPSSNVFSFQKSFYNDGYSDLAVSRSDHSNASGSGGIGSAIIVTTDNLSGIFDVLHMNLYDVKAVTASGAFINLTAAGDSVVIGNAPFSVHEQSALETSVYVYPNPSKGLVTISSPAANVERIDIYNTLGVLVYNEEHPALNVPLDLGNFENGIYIVTIKTDKGTVNKRITISK